MSMVENSNKHAQHNVNKNEYEKNQIKFTENFYRKWLSI